MDFYCSSEWEPLADVCLLEVFTAFSRDQVEKIYVQDRILEQARLIWDLIENQKSWFFVAGLVIHFYPFRESCTHNYNFNGIEHVKTHPDKCALGGW
jgi:hypothetical protein